MNGLCRSFLTPLGIQFGTAYLLFSFVLMIGILVFDRSTIGFGTGAVMTLNGYVSDLVFFLLNLIPIEGTGIFVFRLLLLGTGIILMCLGVGFCFNTHIGISAYDAAVFVIVERTVGQKKYKWIRIANDSASVVAGFLLGSVPGIGTLILAFFTAPCTFVFRSAC